MGIGLVTFFLFFEVDIYFDNFYVPNCQSDATFPLQDRDSACTCFSLQDSAEVQYRISGSHLPSGRENIIHDFRKTQSKQNKEMTQNPPRERIVTTDYPMILNRPLWYKKTIKFK